jgi:peptidoglycan/LPS O-acetylase OafA/YrhL
MLAKYKNAGNIALGASALCFLAVVVLTKDSTPKNVFDAGGAPAVLMPVSILGICVAFWAYAKGKGHSGWLGIVLPFLSIIGLIILLTLKDKHPEDSKAANTVLNKSVPIWVIGIVIVIGFVALKYVFGEIQKGKL